MKRFRFRFAAVVKQRSAHLDAATTALSVERRKRLELEQQRAGLVDEWAAIRAGGPTVGVEFNAHFELLRHRSVQAKYAAITALDGRLKDADTAIETARLAVTEAHRELKAMQKLEERDRAHWLKESRREEQKEADERNAQRFGR